MTRGELVGLTAVGFGALLGVWLLATWTGLTSPQFLPSPLEVGRTFAQLTREPFAGFTLQAHLLSSFGRFFLGFSLAVAVGIPLGLLMGWFRRIDDVVSPLFEALRFVAPLAWVPFAALWFGTGIGGPILVIFSGAFPPCVINAYRGARFVELRFIEAAQTLGASHFRMIADVLIPGSLPSLVAGLRVSAGLAWQSLVGAELIVVGSGIGYEIISAFSSGTGLLAGVWAPNNYTLEQRMGAKTVCTGKDAGAVVPGTLVVRGEYAKEHPDLVARYLAVYLRSIAWQKKNPKETVEHMKKFYNQGGVILPEKYLQAEIDTRPTYTLPEQLAILDRGKGPSQADQWYSKLGEYLRSTGTLAAAPDPKTFITDEFMKRVAADPKLRAFAEGQ